MSEHFFHFDEHIKVEGLIREIKNGVALQHGVIKIDMIVTDNKIGLEKHIHQRVGLIFPEDMVLASACGISHTY